MSSNKRDYYEVLGISKSATQDDIKKAFRKLAMQYHPDRNKAADAEAKFKEINEAYEVLSDDQKRQAYDQYGHAGVDGQSGGFGGGAGGAGFEDIFSQFFRGEGGPRGQNVHFSFNGEEEESPFGDIFSQFFGGGRGDVRKSKDGVERNVEVVLNISFLEHIKGCIKNIKYKYFKSCPHCHGTGGQTPGDVVTCTTCNGNGVVIEERRTPFGTVRQRVSCPHCRGTGKIIRNRCNVCRGAGKIEEVQSLEVSIPGGIEESPLVVKNHGNEVNGSRGDLYVHLRISKSNLFMREGNDIYTKAYIDPLVAIAGGPIQVPTPYGLRGVVIKPQTANGEKITVPDAGINNEGNKKWFNTGKKGNLIVQILYAKPNRYNNIELERIKELAKKNNEEVEEYIRKAEKEINHG